MATSATLPIRADVPVEQTWDIASVYPSDAAWEAAVQAAEASLDQPTQYRGHLGESASVLFEALQTRDRLQGDIWRIFLYASMQSAVDSSDQAAQARMQRAGTLFARFGAAVAYIEPELLDLAPGHVGRFLADSDELAVYEHYFDRLERRRTHVRGADVEELLASVGPLADAHYHTYGVLTNVEIDMGTIIGEEGTEVALIQGNVDDLKRSTNPAVRRAAWERYADSYLKVRNTLAGTLAGGVQRDVFFARARRYPSAVEAALEQSHLPRQVYDNLIGAIRAHYPLWHRFWDIKRRAIGAEQLHTYDTFAPLTRSERVIPFGDARELILTGLAPMGDEYLATLRRGLTEERWVDWAVNQNKSSGAFSTGAPSTHPFILQSYCDGLLNVSTLAHELGHSMHSHYTWANQPVVYSEYGMFVAETASNFHQALLRAHLLQTETDPDLLLEVLNETMNNFHRYFFIMPILSQFEVAIHAQVERGDGLTAESMSETLTALFREGYGPNVVLDEPRIGIVWAQFGHMFANFYVHQYALGIAAANALAAGVMREGRPAADRYISFLKAGDSVYPLDALKIAGVDLTSPEPIERAFGVLEDVVNRLDKLVGAGPLRA